LPGLQAKLVAITEIDALLEGTRLKTNEILEEESLMTDELGLINALLEEMWLVASKSNV